MSRWAVVASNGTLSRGSGVSSVTHVGTGTYRVTFNQDVTNCAYVATVGSTGTGLPSEGRFVVTARESGNPNAVAVGTLYRNGTSYEDNPFHLAVAC